MQFMYMFISHFLTHLNSGIFYVTYQTLTVVLLVS